MQEQVKAADEQLVLVLFLLRDQLFEETEEGFIDRLLVCSLCLGVVHA